MFVLFKFRDCTKLKVVRREQNLMEIAAPKPPAAFSRLRRVKRSVAFPFKPNLVLKTVAAFF